MLTTGAKAHRSSCSQTVSLSPAISSQFILRLQCAAAENRKINKKNPYFGSSESFKVIDVDTTRKLVTSACCDKKRAHAYLQLFSRKTGHATPVKKMTFTGVPLFEAIVRRFP